MVQVPRHELEPVGPGVEVDVEVLPDGQHAVERREPHGDGHEPGELVDVDEVAELSREFRVVGAGDELAELDHPAFLPVRQFRLGVVGLVVFDPVVAEVVEEVRADGLEQRALVGAEVVLCEVPVDVLDDRVQPDVLPVKLVRDADVDPRVRGL